MSSPRRQLVFIGRIVYGGGAEAMVLRLLDRIDRSRFRPVLITMYEQEGLPVELPDDVAHACLRLPVPDGLPFGKRHLPPESAPDHGEVAPPTKRRLREFAKRVPGLKRVVRDIRPLIRRELGDLPESFPYQMALDTCSGLWRDVQALSRVLDDLEPDAVLAPQMEDATILTWMTQAKRARPYVSTVHTLESRHIRICYPNDLRRGAYEFVFRSALSCASAVTVVGPALADDLASHFHVRNGLTEHLFAPVDAEEIRRLGAEPVGDDFPPGGDPVITMVARLDNNKGHGLALEAAAELERRGVAFCLMMIGGGAGEPAIRSEIAARGLGHRVVMVGHKPNPHAYVARSRVSIVTSRYEGLSLVPVEAMALGVPTVAMDCEGGGPRASIGESAHGVLVPDADVAAFADAIERLLTDDAAHAQVCSTLEAGATRFDPDVIARRYQQIVEDAASRVGPAARKGLRAFQPA